MYHSYAKVHETRIVNEQKPIIRMMYYVGLTCRTMHKTMSLERHILNNSSIAISSCCEVELSSFTTLQAPASANTAAFFL